MNCTHCQTPLPDEARFCFSCGSDLSGGGVKTVVRPRDVTAELQERMTQVLAGRYRVQKLLGAGGMGAVFLANDLTLEREVAIKVLPPDMSRDDRVVARFQREAKTAAKLDHPNIIPIHRVESEGGLHYFVMKYVTGRSLDSMLDDGRPLPIPFAMRVLSEAAAALGHAHARGVVHRDVKPANIMLGGDDQVVLTDFGISKVGDLTAQLTQTGMIIGTPHYMAPEQATGRDVDGRADQYSLAVVGHQLFTGKLLFSGDSAHTIIYRHVSEEPPRASSLRPDIPPAADAALHRALRKDPNERFATMEDFARAMRGEVVASTTSRPSTRALNAPTVPVRRHTATKKPSRMPAVVIALALLLVGGAAAAWQLIGRSGPTAPTVASNAVTTAPPPPSAPPRTTAAVDTATGLDTSASAPARSSTDAVDSAPTRRSPVRPLANLAARRAARRATSEDNRERPEPQFARLTVASEPYGTLYIDGVEVGDTPIANHPLPIGRRVELRVERDGYRTKRESIMVSGPNPVRRRYILEPAEQP